MDKLSIVPLPVLDYSVALAQQRRADEPLLLFVSKPVYTYTSRTTSDEFFSTDVPNFFFGIPTLKVSRGGRSTYHGPGQIVGFPSGSLSRFVRDSRGVREFFEEMKKVLSLFVFEFLRRTGDKRVIEEKKGEECPGIWLRTTSGQVEKVASFGFSFPRGMIAHGFSINLFPTVKQGFDAIMPCGISQKHITSLCLKTPLSFEEVEMTFSKSAERLKEIFFQTFSIDNARANNDTSHRISIY